ncbi:nuclear transport factor 2 family protein [Gordonia sp. SL306]|uniref:nuclear transport factor 2 family protein n=1 Tax=Gordonia sp. SL306 TaxID=2995145 RepID=UPI00227202BF|nr:nuclear transport factor 2 family protein [Gordonia sp. SL306]WAC53581.1 nuclear transport factor 2 family protein [Gordonia sp. SL306]
MDSGDGTEIAVEDRALEDRLAALEARVRRLEDSEEITQLIASYGPLVDDGDAENVAHLWDRHGSYDVDGLSMTGRDDIAAMVRSRPHQGLIAEGCAHLLGPVRVHVDGDSAVAVCHSLLIRHQDHGFVVHRATANHFTLDRTADGWRIGCRTSRALDGQESAHLLLGAGARGEHP